MKNLTIAVISLLILCSCATVNLENNLPLQQLDEPINENKTRVVFFNTSNKILYADGSWRIGIKIDGNGIANLHFDQYVQIDLAPGKHSLELSHVDVFTFRDKYDFMVKDKTMYVEVYNGIVSTKYKILPSKPDNFEMKFRPINKG